VTSWAQFRHSRRAGIFLALLLLVVETREYMFGRILLNGLSGVLIEHFSVVYERSFTPLNYTLY
jgi:hypothetical protein